MRRTGCTSYMIFQGCRAPKLKRHQIPLLALSASLVAKNAAIPASRAPSSHSKPASDVWLFNTLMTSLIVRMVLRGRSKVNGGEGKIWESVEGGTTVSAQHRRLHEVNEKSRRSRVCVQTY